MGVGGVPSWNLHSIDSISSMGDNMRQENIVQTSMMA